jgi:hypothetical protein
MKKVFLFLALLLGVVLISSVPAKTKVKSYYSGDAINYNNKLVVASTDSEGLEIFSLNSNGLERHSNWRPFDKRFNKDDSFYGVKLNIEKGRLYAYAISGFTLFKYDISNLNNPVLVKELKNNLWEWYNKVDKVGDKIATISAKGVKVYNSDLEVIDTYDIDYEYFSSISSAGNPNLIFALDEENNKIEVFDTNRRSFLNSLEINFFGGQNNRSMYFDQYENSLYLADDMSVKKIGLDGSLRATFEHLGYPGYDVSSIGNEYLYFANGLGIVKLNKKDLSVVNSRRTGSLSVDEGWAMGLKTVSLLEGERVVVFNNSSIIIMNSDLELLDYVVASVEEDRAYALENLFLNLDYTLADSGTEVNLQGGGFLPGEELVIDFYKNQYKIQANSEGRFSKKLIVPDLTNSNSRDRVITQSENNNGLTVKNISERVDVKVTGQSSNYTYSTTLDIRDTVIIN